MPLLWFWGKGRLNDSQFKNYCETRISIHLVLTFLISLTWGPRNSTYALLVNNGNNKRLMQNITCYHLDKLKKIFLKSCICFLNISFWISVKFPIAYEGPEKYRNKDFPKKFVLGKLWNQCENIHYVKYWSHLRW